MTPRSCPRCGRYTTAPTHCGADVGQVAVCGCGDRAMAHGYRAASGRNDGACLGLGCGCAAYVENGEKALGMGGLNVATWENVASPQGALTPAGSDHRSILETNGG